MVTSSADDTVKWPTSTAERTKLYIPPDYGVGGSNTGGEECMLKYDPRREAILVVRANNVDTANDDGVVMEQEDEDTILDAFYVYDIVGADVEIKLLGSAGVTPPRSTTTTTVTPPRIFTNKSPTNTTGGNNNDDEPLPGSPTDENVTTDGGGCDIFKPLKEDMDKIFSTCNNEPLSDLPLDTQATAVLSIYVYPRKDPSQQSSPFQTWCGMGGNNKLKPNKQLLPNTTTTTKNGTSPPLGNRYAHHRRFEVAPSEDFSNLSDLVRAIRKVSRPKGVGVLEQQQQQRMLVVINPMSGPKKNGVMVCDSIVSPMLEQAGISHDILVTTHPGHAGERMAPINGTTRSSSAKKNPNLKPSSNKTNGDMTEQEEDEDLIEEDISLYTAIVTIGGDGIAHEVLQGISTRPDATQIFQKLQLGIIGTGSSNGMAKTLAHWSEELCSPLDSAFFIAKGKTCPVDLSRYETSTKKYLSFLTFTWSMIADIDIDSEAIHWMGSTRFDLWGVWCVAKLRRYRAKFSYLPVTTATTSSLSSSEIIMPALTEPVPKEWITLEDDFLLFWASHVTHAGETNHHAPQVRPQDGFFTVFIVRGKISRFRMAMILLGLENGTHVSQDGAEFIQCLAYRLEPLSPGSYNDLDGEVIEEGPIQAHVLPSAIRTFCNIDAK